MICDAVPTQVLKRLKRPEKCQKHGLHAPCAAGIKKAQRALPHCATRFS